MKVLDLQCAHLHSFEGWFASEDDFQSQNGCTLIACPACGNSQITKLLSAPRLNLTSSRGEPQAVVEEAPKAAQVDTVAVNENQAMASINPEQLQAAWIQVIAQVMSTTEDVGYQFAEEARKIHYGESEERGIRGLATSKERQELIDEGIAVVPLDLAAAVMKGSVH